MADIYAIILDPSLEVTTLRVENIDLNDHKIGIHNISEWVDDTEFARHQFAEGFAMWFSPNGEDFNVVGSSLMGNHYVIKGPVVLTTWARRGIDTKGILDEQIPTVWLWIEEIIAFNKLQMDAFDITLGTLKKRVENEIIRRSRGKDK